VTARTLPLPGEFDNEGGKDGATGRPGDGTRRRQRWRH